MGAPAKFLFDVDFAKGADRKPAEPSITLAEHALKLSESEASAHARGYADAQADAKVEADRRMADTLEYSSVALPLSRIDDALLRELEKEVPSLLEYEGDSLVIKHLYIERRMVPLNLFLQNGDDAAV